MKIAANTPTTSINPGELRATRPVVIAVHAATGCLQTAKRAAVQLGATQGQDWSQEADLAAREVEHMKGPRLLLDMIEQNDYSLPTRA